jgi:ubiquinone/menaquinone biosynthesis C-methylase UbiE
MVQRYLAGQLGRPTGLVGKYVLGPVWNRRNARRNDVTLACLELRDEDRVLDVGFGGGHLLERVIAQVGGGLTAGVDVSSVMVEALQARWREAIRAGQADIRVGQAEALPYTDRTFTRVSSVNSVMYWRDLR